MYVNVRVRVPFCMWLDIMKFALRTRIHPKLVMSMMIDHGYSVLSSDEV